MFTIMKFEWKSIFRQRFSYVLFFLYFTLSMGIILLQTSLGLEKNYNYTVSAISQLMLYLLPIISLLTSSFSILQDKENGQLQLIHTYPIHTFSYVNGKWLGSWLGNLLFIVLSFYLASIIGDLIFHISLSEKHYSVLAFLIGLSFFYSLIGTLIGTLCHNRWQGLIYSLFTWLLHIILWTSIIVLISRFLPFPWVKYFLQSTLFLNPAEYLRLLFILQFDSAPLFGASHATFISLLTSSTKEMIFFLYALIIYSICIFTSSIGLGGKKDATHSNY